LLPACKPALSEKAIALTVPNVIVYDKETQAAAAAEMKKYCGVTPTMCNMIVDYGVMRDQARAALGEKVDVTR
jgi:hypothetical protein